jgi:phospho-N-acetylmuramoyl-pentapeptide-transferase
MGGVVILLAVIISVFLWTKLNNKFIICLIIGTVCFGLLGFYDDYLKFKKKSQQDFL